MAGAASFEISLVDKMTGPLSKMTGGLDSMMGGLNGTSGAVDGLTSSIDPLTIAIGAAIAVLVAFGAAVLAGFLKVIEATQAKDKIRAVFDAFGDGAGSGAATMAMLDELSLTLPQTAGELWEMGKAFAATGMQGDLLKNTVHGMAAATALMGKEGGDAFERMTLQLRAGGKGADTMMKAIQEGGAKSAKLLNDMGLNSGDLAAALGVSVEELSKMKLGADQMGDALTAAIQKKGAGSLKAMGLTWDTITAKIDEGFGDAFENMGDSVTPFMEAVQSLASEFYKGSTNATLLEGVVGGVFKTLMKAAEITIGVIHKLFLRVEIMALKAAIAVAPLVKMISDGGDVDGWKAFEVAMEMVLGLVVAVGLALGALIAIGAALLAPFIWVGAKVYEVVVAFGILGAAISGGFGAAVDWLSALDFGAIATGWITGLVNGIKNGVGLVVGAVKGLASSMVSGIKGALGIHSPSTVAEGISENVVNTTADTITDGADQVEAAGRDMGKAISVGAEGGAAGGFSIAGSTSTSSTSMKGRIVIEGGIHIDARGRDDIMDATEEAFAVMLERLALQQGLLGARG